MGHSCLHIICSCGSSLLDLLRQLVASCGQRAHHLEAPDGPEGLEGPEGGADDVDDAGEGVAAKGLDAADEAGVAPVVGEGQRRRDGRPDTEDDVHAEKQEEDCVRERAVLDRRIVHAHVPARVCNYSRLHRSQTVLRPYNNLPYVTAFQASVSSEVKKETRTYWPRPSHACTLCSCSS